MMHLLELSLIWSSCYVGMVFSLPVKSFIIAERSVVILGLISCISVGALLGACLFCKRRKRKFEKFENEGNSPTEQTAVVPNTAYPIFRALTTSSPEISRVQPAVIVAQTPTNRSSDNLLDGNNGDNDNNNGIISQADMENIENNNAIDYIPALIAVQHRSHQHHGTELIVENEIRLSSSSSSAAAPPHHTLDCQSPPEQLTSPSITETNLFHPDTNQITSPEECSLTSVSILMPPDENFLDPFDDMNFNLARTGSKDDDEEIMLRDKVEITCEKNPFNKYLIEHQISEDNTSVSSISTGSTPEINSVEEALRALDIAIEGEDVSPDEPLNCQEFSPDELLDVIVQGIKNDCLEMSNKLATYSTISNDVVREEAQMLVDDVLGKAQQLYEVLTTHKSLELPKETTLIDEPKDEFVFPKPISTVATLKSQLTIEQDDDPFESFSSQILDSTSTPAFGPKTTRHEHSSVNPAVQKLNFDDESSPVIANDCTFDVSMTPVAGNATFEVPKQQQQTISYSPPLIKVENRDMDANSDELLPTITPVNTPNELNFPTETWNKIVAKNLMKNRPADADLDLVPANIVFDRTFDKTFDNTELIDTDAENVGGGWFLHPQIVPKFNDLATTSTQQQDGIVAGGDETFDVPDDGDDFNADFRDKNIEVLRMHLTATLGHGGPGFGSAAEGNQEHSDDDEDLSGPIERTGDHFGIKYGDVEEATNIPSQPIINKTEIILNYNKRSLSPIMEESEDEVTCKTFVCNNETQRLDSTSTGLVESEAIMGVTKTLMASNDTLYNFEDPLNDENIFSPRTQSQNEMRSALELSDVPFAIKYPLEPLPLIMESNLIQSVDLDKTPTGPQRPFELPLQLDRMDVNDVLSPDQEPDLTYTVDEKTCVTVKHNSTKLKGDNDEERISEISEPDLVSTSSAHDKFLKTEDDDDLTSIEEDLPEEMYRPYEDVAETVILPDDDSDTSSENTNSSDTTPKQEGESPLPQDNSRKDDEPPTQSSSDTQAIVNDSSFSTSFDSNNLSPNNLQYQNENINFLNSEIKYSSNNDAGRNKIQDSSSSVIVKTVTKAMVADINNGNGANDWSIRDKIYQESPIMVTTTESISVNNKEKSTSSALDSINLLLNKHRENNYVIHEIDFESIGEGPLIGLSLSGEEDPWVATDIRVAAPCQDMMSTSFQTNDWESEEEESSNSSEEFMYMYVRNKESKDTPEGLTEINLSNEHPTIMEEETPETIPINGTSDIQTGIKDEVLWSPHKDQVPVIGETDEVNNAISDINSDSEDEGEFVPSSWDSMAQPARSALKSPDKILDEEPKKRRNVAFKVQRYHSVYEYPKEVIELSPAYSEPQLWKHSFETFMEAQRREPPTPQQPDDDLDMDITGSCSTGFSVSSSTRPFHCNQFNHAQCNTWPGDQNDFSWSQIEDLELQNEACNDSKMFQGSSFIEWPKHLTEENVIASLDSSDRPDSGVGESVEFSNAESLSLGALRHAKDMLKLPICTINITPSTDMTTVDEDESNDSHVIELENHEETSDELNYVKITNGTGATDIEDDEKEATILDSDTILPTPSCTGSMDSLSSSNSSMSGSENRSSKGRKVISTIRRVDKNVKNEDMLNDGSNTKQRQLDGKLGRHLSARLSDSTDEDSGIENLTRVSK